MARARTQEEDEEVELPWKGPKASWCKRFFFVEDGSGVGASSSGAAHDREYMERSVWAAPQSDVRLVGGAHRCAGTLEVKHREEWRPLYGYSWSLEAADFVCKHLDCGTAISVGIKKTSNVFMWLMNEDCVHSGSALWKCATPRLDKDILELTCSDSVRLLNGTSLCSGRLEVKSSQGWSSVCESDFDQQDAEVVCRELGCGAPSVLHGELYGDVEALTWTKEFQCGGNEAALQDCKSSDSPRSSCSPGKAIGLTCSEPESLRLVGGPHRCAGIQEVKVGEWRPMLPSDSLLKNLNLYCEHLDCGSVVSIEHRNTDSDKTVLRRYSRCNYPGSVLRECVSLGHSKETRYLTCSGRLEVKSNQGWSSVCDSDFGQQDAEVVCRDLGCGAPSVFQGALYGDMEAPLWTKEFQCGGNESTVRDCKSSSSAQSSCSPGKAVGLTCSDPTDVRLVGGARLCTGMLMMKHQGQWAPADVTSLKTAAVLCQHLGCSALRECVYKGFSYTEMELTCSDSVRLLNGTSLCSGRLEVKSNQGWSSVCDSDFDQQDAEVVCRDLSCGTPSVFQGALYGDVETSMWTKEFHCGGSESSLHDCKSSDSARSSCSPGKAVGLTCSELSDVRSVEDRREKH
ncbi:scavenger receptor cysteine-rich type 1 protein M130-like [Pholidichthys leucotaenia]